MATACAGGGVGCALLIGGVVLAQTAPEPEPEPTPPPAEEFDPECTSDDLVATTIIDRWGEPPAGGTASPLSALRFFAKDMGIDQRVVDAFGPPSRDDIERGRSLLVGKSGDQIVAKALVTKGKGGWQLDMVSVCDSWAKRMGA